MNILLTGGSGDLGTLLAVALDERGDQAINLDVASAQIHNRAKYIKGSITDRAVLAELMPEVDAIIHIAAWHGIHEVRGYSAYDFWDVNVTGTFNVFQAAIEANVKNIVFISSTSIEERFGVYGHTKVLSEEIALTYHKRHQMSVMTLRPRAFIPHWNKATYANYIEWANWFWSGAVHIDDVMQASLKALDYVSQAEFAEYHALTVDGAYEYTDEDLNNWQGIDSFNQYYADYLELVQSYGLDPAIKPSRYDIRETERLLGYKAQFSLKNLLEELAHYGEEGSPRPF